jgi:hypothetical protein
MVTVYKIDIFSMVVDLQANQTMGLSCYFDYFVTVIVVKISDQTAK